MDSYVTATIVFACVVAGSLIGLALNVWLPEHHRSAASHDAIKLGTGMISVLASLVLGLLTANIKNAFDTTDAQLRSFATNLVLLDQTLRDYGPGTGEARDLLRYYTDQAIRDHWPDESGRHVQIENRDAGRALHGVRLAIIGLPTDTVVHQALRDSALKLIETALQTRWLLIERAETSIQPAFLIILIAWIVLIFLSFGYNAPANATVLCAFVICAGAIAGCLFIIIEMDAPFDGLIAISSHPMRNALAHMSE
ncbi:MAG: hypothetical protein WDN25_26100 [Acetobacteraceae bacterium]